MDKAEYEERQQNKLDRYQAMAEKNRDRAEQSFKGSHDLTKGIPMGQPILVGHHSEGMHRRTIERSHNLMRKGIECQDKAEHYERKAEATENNRSISGDDPEAVQKLKAKLEKLQEKQKHFRAVNKICKSKRLSKEEKSEKLKKDFPLFSDTSIHTLLNPKYSYMGMGGYESYVLSNNNANMKSIEKRIKNLEYKAELMDEETVYPWGSVHQNTYENRLQVFFNEIPDRETRTYMKQNGFRWSKYQGSWQVYISGAGQMSINALVSRLNKPELV